MSSKTLFDKIWDLHTIRVLPNGQYQLFIGMHLIHEVTSPQAFEILENNKLKVKYPALTFATVDHIVPTDSVKRPFKDSLAEKMISLLDINTKKHNIKYFDTNSVHRGIVHVMAPELGLIQPGMTIACGDSHTSTHGAFGALAFGIGSTNVAHVLATQTLVASRLKVKKIEVYGKLQKGCFAKDLILKIIKDLGINGGIGYAYEYTGSTIHSLEMEARMTICNMSIEGGALIGYVNPDDFTFSYLKGRKYAPHGYKFKEYVKWWRSFSSDGKAIYDAKYVLSAKRVVPMITWGTNPGQSIEIDGRIPTIKEIDQSKKEEFINALKQMGFNPGQELLGTKINVVFIGSCTNSRISDLRIAAKIMDCYKVSKDIRCLVVPGSNSIKKQAEVEGLDKIFKKAGAEWREPGCSMCLAMNPDRLFGNQICVSTSNRNFIGRMGSQNGRIILASPATAAAAAITGKISDPRDFIN